jgi:hypothetical protein
MTAARVQTVRAMPDSDPPTINNAGNEPAVTASKKPESAPASGSAAGSPARSPRSAFPNVVPRAHPRNACGSPRSSCVTSDGAMTTRPGTVTATSAAQRITLRGRSVPRHAPIRSHCESVPTNRSSATTGRIISAMGAATTTKTEPKPARPSQDTVFLGATATRSSMPWATSATGGLSPLTNPTTTAGSDKYAQSTAKFPNISGIRAEPDVAHSAANPTRTVVDRVNEDATDHPPHAARGSAAKTRRYAKV